jgi:hypothetical protein
MDYRYATAQEMDILLEVCRAIEHPSIPMQGVLDLEAKAVEIGRSDRPR